MNDFSAQIPIMHQNVCLCIIKHYRTDMFKRLFFFLNKSNNRPTHLHYTCYFYALGRYICEPEGISLSVQFVSTPSLSACPLQLQLLLTDNNGSVSIATLSPRDLPQCTHFRAALTVVFDKSAIEGAYIGRKGGAREHISKSKMTMGQPTVLWT